MSGTALDDRREAPTARLHELRAARGVALLDNATFDNSEIERLEHELDAIGAAETEAVRREREAAAVAIAERRRELAAELRKLEDKRLAAVGRAETAARALVTSLREVLATAEEMRRTMNRLDVPPLLLLEGMRGRLGERLSAVLTTMEGRCDFGHLTWASTWRRADADWVREERADLSVPIEGLTKGIDNDED